MPHAVKTLAIEVSEDLEADIASLSLKTGRSQSLIVEDAIGAYVKDQLLWLDDMDAALRDIRQSGSYDGNEVLDWLDSWGSDTEKPRPTLSKP